MLMSEIANISFLLLTAGVGVALFFAAREFVKGIRLATQEYNARSNAGSASSDQSNPNEGTEPPQRDETPHRPWYKVLEVEPTAGPEEIKIAYRRMIALYHPDKVNNLGVDLRAMAEMRAKEINAAYAMARKMRGL
jgi:DnaJ-class molecular chaperone